jgi:putative transcriptional regulator
MQRDVLDARTIRLSMPSGIGDTQETFANFIGVSVKTLRNWEQGRRKPTNAAYVLLAAIKRDPSSMVRIINAAKTTRTHRRN